MKISLASDHGGIDLKNHIKNYLINNSHEVSDYGCFDDKSVDYPDYGYKAALAVSLNEVDRGIIVCTTGIGMSIVANKVPKVRAALCLNSEMAELSRLHNDANVIVFGASFVKEADAEKILDVWLNTSFEGGRHQRRVDKIHQYER